MGDSPTAAPIPCAACGYDLRGLDRGGGCPECGNPVELAYHGDALFTAAPNWVARIRLGGRIAALSPLALLLIVLPVCVDLSGAAAGAATMRVIGGIALLAFPFTYAVGMWLLTTPEPRSVPQHRITASFVTRAATIATILGPIAALAASGSVALGRVAVVVPFIFGPCGLSAVVALAGFAHHSARLAERSGEHYIAGRNRRMARQLAIAWVFFAAPLLVTPWNGNVLVGILLITSITLGAGAAIVIAGLLLLTTPMMILRGLKWHQEAGLRARQPGTDSEP